MRSTQVAIIGAGPSGLILARLLRLEGIDSFVVERRSRAYVEGRVRAGLLEWNTVELLRAAGVGERMMREGLVHDGVELVFAGGSHRIDLKSLAGCSVLVYGQTELQRDLGQLLCAEPGAVVWEASDVTLEEWEGPRPALSYTSEGVRHTVRCDFIAGCDGFHGVSRGCVPRAKIAQYERIYPFGWIGVLAEAPPVSQELVYANHERGFALCSMRSRRRSRYYVQCPLEDTVHQWPDERFWSELHARLPAALASRLITGPSIEKTLAPLRSFVAEPMRFGRLFLVGDAAHIVPPTGAKGLNLAAADARLLARGLVEFYGSGSETLLGEYSRRALDRVWKATRFSWWFTSLMHRFSPDPFAHRLQIAELNYLAESQAASRCLAENYTGVAFDR